VAWLIAASELIIEWGVIGFSRRIFSRVAQSIQRLTAYTLEF
jgi:hypothetical protein